MTATIYALADERDPIGSLRAIEARTGLVAIPRGRFVRLVPKAEHSAEVVQFVPGRGFIPAFLRIGAAPLKCSTYSFDADGPKGAA